MKLKITITGKVHDVGYRVFLFSAAENFQITHFNARNVVVEGKQALEVFIDGEENNVKEFVEHVKSEKPPLATVEEITVEEYDGKIMPIDSFGKILSAEQLNKIIQVGLVMLEKQDKMLEKQDKTIEAIQDTKTYLGEKIDLLRADLKSYMDERFSKMEEEIRKIKAKIGME